MDDSRAVVVEYVEATRAFRDEVESYHGDMPALTASTKRFIAAEVALFAMADQPGDLKPRSLREDEKHG